LPLFGAKYFVLQLDTQNYLFDVLYRCEILSLILREEYRLRVFSEQGVEANIWA